MFFILKRIHRPTYTSDVSNEIPILIKQETLGTLEFTQSTTDAFIYQAPQISDTRFRHHSHYSITIKWYRRVLGILWSQLADTSNACTWYKSSLLSNIKSSTLLQHRCFDSFTFESIQQKLWFQAHILLWPQHQCTSNVSFSHMQALQSWLISLK